MPQVVEESVGVAVSQMLKETDRCVDVVVNLETLKGTKTPKNLAVVLANKERKRKTKKGRASW